MRHHDKIRKFHREKRQRVALFKALSRSLILQEKLTTTIAKAKALRPIVEKLITTSKGASVASRRTISARLGSPEAVTKLHNDLAVRFAKRAGGYTRIIRLGRIGKRVGEQARIEFVDAK